jgi:hypothetical protein
MIFSLKQYLTKSISLILLVAICLIISCQEDSKTFTLGIDVQAHFNQDDVQVFLDDKQVIDEKLQTNPQFPICKGIDLSKNDGNHIIKVIVNGTATKTEVFSLKSNLYIGVNYNALSEEISFIYSNHPFGYR